jgi:hypothetical protein
VDFEVFRADLERAVWGSINKRSPIEQNMPRPSGAWLLWLAITPAAFSWVDWRMTKHLMPSLPALYLAPALWVGRRPTWASAVLVLYGWLIAYQVYWVAEIAHDFGSFSVIPAW